MSNKWKPGSSKIIKLDHAVDRKKDLLGIILSSLSLSQGAEKRS